MFRGNLQHTGVYSATGVPAFLKVKWAFHAQAGVISSPAVAGETVYVGSSDHHLYALSRETGTVKWKFKTGSRVTSSPAVAGGLVYFESADGNFYAINAADGQLRWKFQTAGERRYAGKHLHGSVPAGETMPDPFDFYLSSPAVWNGRVYFGSGDGKVYALDAQSGRVVWQFQTGDVVHSSPAIADGVLFIGSWDTYLYALDAVSGAEKWRYKTGDDPEIHNQVGIQSSPVVSGGTVYFGCRDSNLYAIDAATGQKKWSFSNHGSWVIGSPAVQQGKLYFSTSDSGMFYALDAAAGTPVFSLKFLWPMFSSPAVAGSTVYIGSHEGKLIAIDLRTQKQAWTFQTDGSRQNGPTYTKPDGSPKYEAAFADDYYDDLVSGVTKMLSVGAILASPVIVEDVVYAGSTDGSLYALM